MTTRKELRTENLEYGLLRPSWWTYLGHTYFPYDERKRRRKVQKRQKAARKANR